MKKPAVAPDIMVLGIGNTLLGDEGFGVRALERLDARYLFPPSVRLLDGGVLGVNLLGYIANTRHLIVLDCVRHNGSPGDIHCLRGDQLPERIRGKNSLHQVDFLEALTLCAAINGIPETVVFGVEPADIETLTTDLTPVIREKIDAVIERVLTELTRLGVGYEKRSEECTVKDCMRHDYC